VENIQQFGGGYGKGYVRALDLWRRLIKDLAVLNQNMHVLLIGTPRSRASRIRSCRLLTTGTN
jgi:hypothetical protein